SLATGSDVTFNFATYDGTALIADSDYVARSLTAMTIPSGQMTGLITVVTNQDSKFEADETLNVTLTSLVNANAGDLNGVGTINNDDAAPLIFIGDFTVTEGETAHFAVTISAISGEDVVFTWN